MNKYGPKAQKTIGKTMRRFKEGKLRNGRTGQPVKNRQQAVAIGISEAKDKGYKTPYRERK